MVSEYQGAEGLHYYPSFLDIEHYRRKGPHIGHQMHLCELAAEGQVSLEQFKSMVKDAKFICKSCGRVAAEELNLCNPVPLESAPK